MQLLSLVTSSIPKQSLYTVYTCISLLYWLQTALKGFKILCVCVWERWVRVCSAGFQQSAALRTEVEVSFHC
jgi:hypothetical protein